LPGGRPGTRRNVLHQPPDRFRYEIASNQIARPAYFLRNRSVNSRTPPVKRVRALANEPGSTSGLGRGPPAYAVDAQAAVTSSKASGRLARAAALEPRRIPLFNAVIFWFSFLLE
jgi:hypothetical protein